MKRLSELYNMSGVSEFEIYLNDVIKFNVLNVTNLSELYKLYNIEDTEKYEFKFLCDIQCGKIKIAAVCDMYSYHDHYDCFKDKEIIEEFDITEEIEHKIIEKIKNNNNLKEFFINNISYAIALKQFKECL